MDEETKALIKGLTDAIRSCGTGNAATDMGGMEFIGTNIGAVAEGLDSIAQAISRLAEVVETATKE